MNPRPPAAHRIVHPWLLCVYPILVLYSRNADSVDWREMAAPALTSLGLSFVSFLIARKLLGSSMKAGLWVSTFLIVVFSFGRAVAFCKSHELGPTQVAREWFVLSVDLAAILLGSVALRRRSAWAGPINTALNAGSIALVGLLGWSILTGSRARPIPSGPEVPHAVRVSPRVKDPDIYFLVLDAYGRSDILSATFGFDNRGFLDHLRSLGFHVEDRATANYCQTALSISATLNGKYHDDLDGSTSRSRLPLREVLARNTFFETIRSRGYRIVRYASGFGVTDSVPADLTFGPAGNWSEFNALILDSTPFWAIQGRGGGRASLERHRDRILYALDHVGRLEDRSEDSPTFTFAHILAPHPPFVFGRSGEDLSGREDEYRLADGLAWRKDARHDATEYVSRYREQATYVTMRVQGVVDRILATSETRPIIIIQGDHGPGSQFDSDAVDPNDLPERFGILSASLLPGVDPDRWPVTPVNTFRMISDRYFGTARGFLPDRNDYSSYQTPYRFIDVTGELSGVDPASRAGPGQAD